MKPYEKSQCFMRKTLMTSIIAILLALCVAAVMLASVNVARAATALDKSDVTVALAEGETPVYSTRVCEPELTVKYGATTLEENKDYTVTYENNRFAGEATATVKFKGNYSGKVEYKFDIAPADGTLAVSWEKQTTEGSWTALASGDEMFFGDEVNVRAKLVLDGSSNHEEYVYAKEYTGVRTNNLTLTFGGNDEITSLGNVTVGIVGTWNYSQHSGDTTVAIKTVKRNIAFGDNAFDNMRDENTDFHRLWRLSFNDRTAFSYLRDKARYYDPSSTAVDHATQGEENDAYARFRGKALHIELNDDYVVAGKPISWYLANADSVVYTHKDPWNNAIDGNTGLVGAKDLVTAVNTTVTLTFGDEKISLTDKTTAEYTVSGNTLTLKKSWYIVNINNALRSSTGGDAEVAGWTYGKYTEINSPRPEHGNLVYWTLSMNSVAGSTTAHYVMERFAVEFEEDGTEKTYKAELLADDSLRTDKSQPLGKSFAEVLSELPAGSYRLEAYVPEVQSDADSSHIHWWEEGDTPVSDYGTYYYGFNQIYTFGVGRYNIAEAGLPQADRLVTAQVTGSYYYTGSSICPDEAVTVEFDGQELVQGIDYTLLYSDNVNFGSATVMITGVGNFIGTIVCNFDIWRAQNSWATYPGVVRWMYHTFNREINLFDAVPAYIYPNSEVTFSVSTDKNGVEPVNLVEGLESFKLEKLQGENGDLWVVSSEVADLLNELGAGRYYLFAKVDETESYDRLTGIHEFVIERAPNRWVEDPDIISWTYGSFDETVNKIIAFPVYGEAADVIVTIKDKNGSIVFTSDQNLSRLGTLEAGKYKLTVEVEDTDNYTGLMHTIEFIVEEGEGINAGLLATLIIFAVFDVLLLIAVVLAYAFGRTHTTIVQQRQVIAARYNAAKADMARLQSPVASGEAIARLEASKKETADETEVAPETEEEGGKKGKTVEIETDVVEETTDVEEENVTSEETTSAEASEAEKEDNGEA